MKTMNTKLLMTISAIFMGLIGIGLSFIPDEILEITGYLPSNEIKLGLQLAGALYLGFAMTNWMAKAVLIGGIYSKPLCIGNFSHFFIASLALVKFMIRVGNFSIYMLILTIIYTVLAISFGYVLFTHPKQKSH